MKITYFRAFPDSYRKSMAIYADQLFKGMSSLLPQQSLMSYLPRKVHLSPPFRYWSQYIRYQLGAFYIQGDINHILDHSYSHLIHSLNNTKTIITFHDAIGLKVWNGTFNSCKTRTQLGFIQRFNFAGLRKAAKIICVSENTKKDLLHYFNYPPENIKVIYEGIEKSFFDEPRMPTKKYLGLSSGSYILHVGHTRWYKNIPALFYTLSILVRHMKKNVRLLKVGEAFTQEQLRLAKDLGVIERIVHLGEIPDKFLPHVYRCSDVLLFPSLYEGFGFPVLEAMACGVPVVASNRGSLPEVVDTAGILINPEDYGAIAKAITDILEKPVLRSKLREAGLNHARKFTWENTAKRTLETYETIYKENCKS